MKNYYAFSEVDGAPINLHNNGSCQFHTDDESALADNYKGRRIATRRDIFRYEGYWEHGDWHPNENLPEEPVAKPQPKPTDLDPALAAVVPSRFVAIEDHGSGAYKGKVLGSNSLNASLDRAISSHDYKTDKAFTLYEAVAHVSAKPEPVPQPERVVVRAG